MDPIDINTNKKAKQKSNILLMLILVIAVLVFFVGGTIKGFAQTTYNLALQVNPSSWGTTSGAGPGAVGSTREIKATAKPGYVFSNWAVLSSNGSISDPNSNPAIFTFGAGNGLVRANFSVQTYRLTVTKDGTGSGGVLSTNPAGDISCGTSCYVDKMYNSSITLKANASAGSAFTGWSGACTGTNNLCTVTMDTAKDVKATFTLAINGAWGNWGSCVLGNNGTQSRNVYCRRSDGVIVNDSFCTGAKPTVTQNCTIP
ncbi:MAG TPA: hypothetical protein P5096_03825 [Patescibacteria group bacterium]|nr:hypothetical protein [Patescibacteria group bacterium]